MYKMVEVAMKEHDKHLYDLQEGEGQREARQHTVCRGKR